MASVAALATALFLPAVPASAQQNAIDFSRAGRTEVYQNLPGVVPMEEAEARKRKTVCVRKPAEMPLDRKKWRAEEEMVYSCTQGSLTVETNRLPRSRERDLRGIGW